MLSNGCSMSECSSMKSYLIEIIEKIYDPDGMNPILFTHYLYGSADSEVIEIRDDTSSEVDLLKCGSSNKSDSVIYDDYFAHLCVNTHKDTDEWVVLMINLCLPEDGSVVCDGNVKIIVVNVGSDLVASGDFSCLADGGTTGENYSEYNDFDEASIDNSVNGARDEICENRTPLPTNVPTEKPSESPINKPTSSPTYSYCDLGNKTMGLVFMVSLGCILTDIQCAYSFKLPVQSESADFSHCDVAIMNTLLSYYHAGLNYKQMEKVFNHSKILIHFMIHVYLIDIESIANVDTAIPRKCAVNVQYDSIEHGNDCGRTKRTHITTKTALKSESLFLEEGKDKVIIQDETCFVNKYCNVNVMLVLCFLLLFFILISFFFPFVLCLVYCVCHIKIKSNTSL